jgi:hypothetical protein
MTLKVLSIHLSRMNILESKHCLVPKQYTNIFVLILAFDTGTHFGFLIKGGLGWPQTHFIAQVGLEHSILLPQPPEVWDYRNLPLLPAASANIWFGLEARL